MVPKDLGPLSQRTPDPGPRPVLDLSFRLERRLRSFDTVDREETDAQSKDGEDISSEDLKGWGHLLSG